MKNHEYHEAVLASDLSANAKLTALAIAYHFNWKGSKAAFPSIATLVKRTSLSRASVYRAKAELSKAGYLDSTRRFNDSNLYVPVIPDQSLIDTLGVSEGSTNNELNYEYNNEKEKDSKESLVIFNNNIQGERVSLEEYWKAFG
jgi:DNA-binding transcriptional MocR family regulator